MRGTSARGHVREANTASSLGRGTMLVLLLLVLLLLVLGHVRQVLKSATGVCEDGERKHKGR